MRILSGFLFCALLLIFLQPLADDRQAKEKELTKLKNRIEKLRKTIEVKENSKSSYNQQLKKIEQQIGQISRKIRLSNKKIQAKQKSLNTLNHEKKQIRSRINQQNQQLGKQI
nr:hypothetical protein [Gammaproteobacteria bacterium]